MPAIDAMRKDLDVRSASYVPGTLSMHGSRASAPYTATLVMQGLGTYPYSGTLALQKTGGDWKVVPDLTSVHPALQPETHLARTRDLGTRGQLLTSSGTALEGQDAELDSNLLGSVGPLTTAAQAATVGPQFQVGDVAGLSGLERAYNKQLAGLPGGSVVVADAQGKAVQVLKKFAARNGTDVKTTINLNIRRAGGVRTGQRLQAGGTGRDRHPYRRDDRGGQPSARRIQQVAARRLSAGSTFKVITATAGLLAGKTPQTVLQCPKNQTVDGRTFGNAENEEFGPISFQTAFEKSCNTAFINLAMSLSQSTLNEAARCTASTAPSRCRSRAPAATTRRRPTTRRRRRRRSVGAGYHEPAANGERGRGGGERDLAAAFRGRQRSGESRAARKRRRDPANLHGRCRRAWYAAGVGLPAGTAGKTGTAEYGTAPPGGNPPTHAWFIGFRGPVAFAVVVEGGGFGGEVAAPIAANFLDQVG